MKPHRRYVEVKNTNPITYVFFATIALLRNR